MRFTLAIILIAMAMTASAPVAAQAIVVDFQATCGGSTTPPCTVGNTYAGVGLTFTPNNQDVCMGISNGDPGNWGLQGTNSAKFLCFNGGNPGYNMDLTLAAPTNTFSLDVSRSNGSQPGDTFTLNVLNGGTLLGTQTVTLGNINSWTTITLQASGINHVTWTGNGAGFHPYGVDNLLIGIAPGASSPIPAASPWTLAALGLMVIAFGALALRRG
jgi:hypothetical protein